MAFERGNVYTTLSDALNGIKKLFKEGFSPISNDGNSQFPEGHRGTGVVSGYIEVKNKEAKSLLILVQFKAIHPTRKVEVEDTIPFFASADQIDTLPEIGAKVIFVTNKNNNGRIRNSVPKSSEVPEVTETVIL
jgi:hypothetical protein